MALPRALLRSSQAQACRRFSTNRIHNAPAEVKKLGVIGAGQMVVPMMSPVGISTLTGSRDWGLL